MATSWPREIRRRSEERFAFKDGTFYPALRRLEQDGLVESYWDANDATGRRRYYRLTEAGREAHRAWVGEWANFVRSMNAVLGVGS